MERIKIHEIVYIELEEAKKIYNLDGVDLKKGVVRINAINERYKHLHNKLFVAESKLKGKEIKP